MRTITKGWRLSPLTTTKPDSLFFVNREFDRFKVGVFMGTVAKGLVFGFAAGTPPVITGFQFNAIGRGLGTIRFGHNDLGYFLLFN